MTRRRRSQPVTTTSSSIGARAGRPRRRRRWPRGAGLSTRAVRRESRRRRPDLSRHHRPRRSRDRAILGEDYWAGAALAQPRPRRAAPRSSTAPRSGASIRNARDRRLDRAAQRAHDPGAARDHRDRRAGAAVPDSRLDAAGRDDRGRGADRCSRRQGLVPDGRTVMAGSGPLLWLLAAQILRAGGQIDAILDTTPRAQLAARAAASARLRCCRPISPRAWRCCARCKAQGAGHRRRRRARGRRRRTSSRGRVRPAAARAAHRRPISCCCIRASCPTSISRWPPASRIAGTMRSSAGQPVLDADFGNSVPGIAVAGDGAGIGGGTAAAERGRIAAHRGGARARSPMRRVRRSAERSRQRSARERDAAAPSSTRCTGRRQQFRHARGRHASSAAARR